MGRQPQNSRVLISGASIASPALTFWLERYGFDVTVVEKAPEVRRGGQAVDFKGLTHRTVLEQMGILEDVRQARVTSNGDGIIVNATGRQVATVPAALSGGEIEIARGDLARILYGRTQEACEYVFSDSVTSLTETADGIEVTFERSAPRVFDLVVGADGIHSNVRRLAFGPESEYVKHLGYYALAEIGGEVSCEDLMYNEPGRMAATGGPKAPAFFVFASSPLQYGRDDAEQQKRLLIDAYRGGAWKIPELMEQVRGSEGFYMDSISRVTMNRYASGRVVLLGDSTYGNTLGGFGTGLAVVGAYVLAGELHRAQGDYLAAYARYEAKFRKYASVSQKVNAGNLLAPTSRIGLYMRNKMFSVAALFGGMMKLMDRFATDIKLDDYASEG
ncbi:FAD-dependent monooxygenase [Deinococcus altitudinis]|uniref:FAD-dependent monooxygenase n=1 Tax=Deinococcus altitudinis TaxID=468914 RepID=UPI00389136BB